MPVPRSATGRGSVISKVVTPISTDWRRRSPCWSADPVTTRPSMEAIDAIEAIEALFESSEGMAYLGEDVTMIEHQLQAGWLALEAGVPDPLVVAALLHDVGHMAGHQIGEGGGTA